MRCSLLAAGLVGFVLGALCAPKKGTLLRKDIKDGFCELQRNGSEVLEGVQRKSKEFAEKASSAIAQAKQGTKAPGSPLYDVQAAKIATQ